MDEKKVKKTLNHVQARTLRDLVDFVNQVGLQKEDILLVQTNGENGFYMLYYR